MEDSPAPSPPEPPSPVPGRLRCGVVISTGGAGAFAELAVAAEEAGWDGIFSYEVPWGQDAWVTLTAAAMRTSTIRLGTMLTPLPRVLPWELAARAATLDDLSGGRVQLAVGMGALHEGWLAFERDEGRRVRAEKLDEGLAVYDGLMRGQPFSWSGKHYRVTPTTFLPPPPPTQRPRVPVWVVGAHPSERSLGRAARWDGLLPARVGSADPLTPADLPEIVSAVRSLREAAGLPWDGYEVVAEGISDPGAAGDDLVAQWRASGATWWVESDWALGPDAVQRHRRRIEAGPPRA